MKTLRNLKIFDTLGEMVDPEHTALVLWDCQNGLVDGIHNREDFLESLKELLDAARLRKIAVVFSLITPVPAGFQSGWGIYQAMKRFKLDDPAQLPVFMQPGSPEAEINAALSPAEDELVLNKYSPNIFFGTNFGQLMRSRGIRTILFTGIATEYGIEHSAREAAIRGFYTIVVSDCVSSRDKTMHEMALEIMRQICLVVPSNEVLGEWA